MNIYNLKDIGAFSREMVGGKAYGLGRLSTLNDINMAPGICLTVDYFDNFINTLGINDLIMSLMSEIACNPILSRKNLAKIRETVLAERIPKTTLDEIILIMKSAGIKLEEGVSVRSSSIKEDSDSKTYAGVFSSSIDLKNRAELEQGILKTWASSYSEVAYYYSGKGGISQSMAVIIQSMVYGDLNGVLFSVAPDDSNYMQVEASSKIGGIVEGGTPDLSMKIPRDGRNTNTNSEIDFNELKEITLKIEKIWGTPVDLEWSYYHNKFYIMQCRAISTELNKIDAFTIVNQDDVNLCSKVNLGLCSPLFHKYLGKQFVFRKKVSEHGFHLYKQVYIIYKKQKLKRVDIENLKKEFSTKHLIVEYNATYKPFFCLIESLYDLLMREQMKIPGDMVYFRIAEVIPADLSGYSTVTENGSIYIEYVPGRMHGLIKGMSPPTQVIISDTIRYINQPIVPYIETVDRNTGKRMREHYGKQARLLTMYEVDQISLFTKNMMDAFGQARLEWYIYKDKLYGKDISIEKNDLNYTEESASVISLGSVSGIAFFLEDLHALDEIAEKYDISLIPHSKTEEMLQYDNHLVQLVAKITSIKDPIIIFADRPSLGILAISDYVAGFVFRQGSILSHVGISLREKQIPAIISPMSFESTRKGDAIMITPAGVIQMQNKERYHASMEED